MGSNTTGSWNTATGHEAFRCNTVGFYNSTHGYLALDANVLWGYFSNTTATGNQALVTASDQIRFGNISVARIGGQVAWTSLSDSRTKKNIRQDVLGFAFINLIQPVIYNFDLDTADYLLRVDKAKEMLTALSQEEKASREAKQKRLYTGFVAQDVEKAAQSIGYDFSGVDVDEEDIYGLRYSEFVMPLVKAM